MLKIPSRNAYHKMLDDPCIFTLVTEPQSVSQQRSEATRAKQ